MTTSNQPTYDYIIVGGGSAGCVLANRLSESHSVLLLEAGPSDRSMKVRMPAATGIAIQDESRNWHYQTEPQPRLNGRQLIWPRGRMLGGCSSHNLMVVVRGHARDYDLWRQSGCEGWSYSDILPYFKRAESRAAGADTYHGGDGPMQLDRSRNSNQLQEVFIEAGQQAGFPYTGDFNGYQQEGVGWFDLNIHRGNRWDTGRAYLWPILSRDNLTLELNAFSTRLLFDGTRAVGVEYEHDGQLEKRYAGREVVVSAGTINSPQLLQLSGLGAAEDLSKLDIPVVADLPGVGKNLQDHLDVAVQHECAKPVSLYSHVPLHKMAVVGIEWMLFGTGPGATGHSEAGAYIRTDESLETPDIQNHFMPMAITRGNTWPDRHSYQINVCQLRQESRGYLALRSRDPRQHPLIEPNYLQTDNDVRVMRAGVKITREILAQPAFDEFRGAEMIPGADQTSDEAIDAFVREHSETCYHPCGSCKMGADSDHQAVVDPSLQVRGIEGLRVVDASIMPNIVSGNLNGPTIMIAEKAADMILGREALPSADAEVASPVARRAPERAAA